MIFHSLIKVFSQRWSRLLTGRPAQRKNSWDCQCTADDNNNFSWKTLIHIWIYKLRTAHHIKWPTTFSDHPAKRHLQAVWFLCEEPTNIIDPGPRRVTQRCKAVTPLHPVYMPAVYIFLFNLPFSPWKTIICNTHLISTGHDEHLNVEVRTGVSNSDIQLLQNSILDLMGQRVTNFWFSVRAVHVAELTLKQLWTDDISCLSDTGMPCPDVLTLLYNLHWRTMNYQWV